MNVSDVKIDSSDSLDTASTERVLFRYISPDRKAEFFNRGFKERNFFPHKTYYLPKPGPDGFKVACRIFGEIDPSDMVEIVIYASNQVLEEFPDDLFFDDDLVWHQQQFGKGGQIATSSLLIAGRNLYSMIHLSDVVQRISRRREYKTRIENRFKGWPVLLLNSILNFAWENNLENIFTPTSELALEHSNKKGHTKIDLFERIYDLSVDRYYKVQKTERWWKINLLENKDKLVFPEKKHEVVKKEKTICLAHDIEAGIGHVGFDSELVEVANRNHKKYLKEILEIEEYLGIPVTYNIVGKIFIEVKEQIIRLRKKGGYCLAFHSFDHNIKKAQLYKCKDVDYRIKGYRPPQSKITRELSASKLAFNNFEWLASSAYSLQIKEPKSESGMVKIPILFDDYSMYKDKISYVEWEDRVLKIIEENEFIAFCLHDCYAHYWLPYYKSFLSKIYWMGKFKTFNRVAEEEFLSSSL